MQKISSIHKLQQILGSHELKGQAYLKIIEATFSFPELTTPIFGHSHQKIIDQNLIFLNWFQHAKNQAISLICSGDFVHLKILQSVCQKAFWPISQEQDFYQT